MVNCVESWEVLREAIERVGVKAVAAKLSVSPALIYKWCQAPTKGDDDTGARNPLDRLRVITELTRDAGPAHWLCNVAGGFFVANPKAASGVAEEQALAGTHQLVQDFSTLLADISRSITNDGQISPEEASVIRRTWESLKSRAEGFVIACEQGQFGTAANKRVAR